MQFLKYGSQEDHLHKLCWESIRNENLSRTQHLPSKKLGVEIHNLHFNKTYR